MLKSKLKIVTRNINPLRQITKNETVYFYSFANYCITKACGITRAVRLLALIFFRWQNKILIEFWGVREGVVAVMLLHAFWVG